MATNPEFNFEEFAVSAIRTIDEIRSYGRDGASKPIEPRINAFYRAIGLPAVISKDSTQQENNNGNIFSPETINYENYSRALLVRKFAFKRDITQDEISQFLLYNESKLDDGAREITESSARSRGVLYPIIVDGEIPIFPQSKRVATAFRKEDELLVGTVKYHRPLIESIILIRLKSEGAQNQELQNKITNDFGNEFIPDMKEFSSIIYTALINTTSGLSELLAETIKKAGAAKKETGANFNPIIANIAQQSLSRNENSENMIGKIDIMQQKQEELNKIQNAILATLEYDDTFYGDIKESRNIKGTLLSSNLLSVINSGLGNENGITQNLDDTNREKEKHTGNIKAQFRTLDLLLGTFSGISGVDILVVIMALFKININSLIGLLNDEAIEGLKAIKGKDIANSKSPVLDAIDELSGTIIELFAEIQSMASQITHENKQSNRIRGPL